MKKLIPLLSSLFIVAIVLQAAFFANPADAAGAFFFLSPSTGTKSVDSVFFVTVKVNTGDSNINAAEGTINFDPGKMEVAALSKNGSVFTMWTAEPSYNNNAGTINFSGGIPRPGYSGKSGTVITISFKAKSVGDAPINFSSGAILANDGLGTNVLTSMGSASYTISPKTSAPKGEESDINDASQTEGQTGNVIVAKTDVELANALGINSPTHPNSTYWYGQNKIELRWNQPAGVTAQSMAMDNKPDTDPKDQADDISAVKTYDSLKDGIWYFHLKVKTADGWSLVSHFKFMIDSTPPAPFKVTVDQKDVEDLPILFFRTDDGTSGVVRYEVNIGSLEEKAFVVNGSDGQLQVPSLEVGPHTAMIKAVDKAGNETFSTVDFTITPITTPVIKNYSNEIRPTDKFFISGTALAGVDITVYIQKDEERAVSIKTTTDKNGTWYVIMNDGLENGRYVAWVEATNAKGIKSEPSPKVSFLVTPPIFARIGSLVINYFTVFVSLIFMIMLVVFGGILLSSFIRKRLKKETFEVESVLRGNMEGLKDIIDEEFIKLSKARSNVEKSRIKSSLKKRIESAEQKIMKEVKDVENLLK